ncbi:MAG: site-2 protease family protein [Clostridiales bacterium]|nr:site-2 protease family protein [Clostridiales bacterium]MBQ2768761.1 site-2 protease family protein [Clostridia bacterium]
MVEYVLTILAGMLAAIVVISFHEFSHAFVAYKCGDPTAKFSGRMTLNPVKHFDPLGLLTFALVGFGWAKPVPVNPNNFKNYKWGSFWTSAAGIITNYLMAFLFYPLLWVVLKYLSPLTAGTYGQIFIEYLFAYFYLYSLSFCVFNLLPVYPLDGFRIMDAFNTRRGKVYWFLRQYGYWILLGLMLFSYAARTIPGLAVLDVFGYAMRFTKDFIGRPITAFWGLFDVVVWI